MSVLPTYSLTDQTMDANRAKAPKRVLVIDDESAMRKTARAALERAGFAVEEASGGRDGWRLVGEWRPDLVVIDAMLPDVHGFRVVKQIRAAGLTLPVIAISAFYTGGSYADDVKETCGATAYLEKPFRVAELVALVERLIASPAGPALPRGEPQSAEARRRLAEAIAAFRQNDLRAAAMALRAAHTLEPDASVVSGWLGIVYAAAGRDLEAMPLLERAAADGGTWETLRNLALLYERAGFRRKALEAWARTLAAAPTVAARDEARARLAAAT